MMLAHPSLTLHSWWKKLLKCLNEPNSCKNEKWFLLDLMVDNFIN